jgi:hypothetical protein
VDNAFLQQLAHSPSFPLHIAQGRSTLLLGNERGYVRASVRGSAPTCVAATTWEAGENRWIDSSASMTIGFLDVQYCFLVIYMPSLCLRKRQFLRFFETCLHQISLGHLHVWNRPIYMIISWIRNDLNTPFISKRISEN